MLPITTMLAESRYNSMPGIRLPVARLLQGVAAIVGLLLLAGISSVWAADRSGAVASPRVPQFAIRATEDPECSGIEIRYTKPNCALTGVYTSLTLLYLSGERSVVEEFWPAWAAGETKTYLDEACVFQPIREIRLSGTAMEHSFLNGKKILRRITFAERIQLTPHALPERIRPATIEQRAGEGLARE